MHGKSLLVVLIVTLVCCRTDDPPEDDATVDKRMLRLTLRNISAPGALQPMTGAPQDIRLSPGVWAVHDEGYALLRAGAMATGTPTETLAEDGDASALLTALRAGSDVIDAGPIGGDVLGETYESDPIGPGGFREFEIEATAEDRLSLALMFVQSNDTLLATVTEGIALDVAAGQIHDVTFGLSLWDVGTEANEEPGAGPHQAPRQAALGAGDVEGGTEQQIGEVDVEGHAYPAVATFVRLEIEVLAP